jgi:hypothetical protein
MQPGALQRLVDDASDAVHAKADEIEPIARHRLDGSRRMA